MQNLSSLGQLTEIHIFAISVKEVLINFILSDRKMKKTLQSKLIYASFIPLHDIE